ncbi:Crp/Fnr family transcriptional regulator [Rhodospirillum rubrum]|uniref:Transcriptional regulator, Crp/Fnr family n=1 Tax=Rhodospirillum rubrum (strain ATCC 11170 / ATH 1.1.1 / DSM 467 / LMG 4362 / NCIMB 8255 / S1) TaxID=269796 RepID=Q2RUZ9_RHORT|nr:Crp/Fnr family transcriptional regulator [Rhodospirillum rubrum]ABC22046.1 transcriptional regulator, Crp/Fnr family [Rhodospirillum rubrum ATCC 11170]AEO47758.1 Crp/FNR family transcriptional regulator [Rhodospirillum rubrum F11]MBK5953629.1 Crp/Fnr family transcriptional regulator [Rhodospirillum rubrum]QXG81699.1 Crp/Fnr family transcriptional regulator [Rhodospirillum rubrum]HAQ00226.1 Crp/Fnr family transcriptional regulator [Rhodospirillum rubrum]
MTPAFRLPGLAELDAESARVFAGAARSVQVPAGTILFRTGARCESYVLVVSGAIRVHRTSPGGREIVLYRVEGGQSCVLTTNCLIAARDYDAEGVAETDVEMIALPAPTFRRLLAASEAFRDFVFAAYASRLSDLLLLIEEVAFGRIDVRLAGWLAARGDQPIAITHQDLAVELGTAREVISRQLKDFERRGWVDLGRGIIAPRDPQALRHLAEGV